MYPEHINKAQGILLEMKASTLPDLLIFMTKNSQIPRAFLNEKVIIETKPPVWWLAVKRAQAVCKELREIAKTFLVMPTSSGRTERVFSMFGLVQKNFVID